MTLFFCTYRCTWQSNGRAIQLNSVENADNIWTLVPSRVVLLSVTLQNRNLNWFLQKCSTYPSIMSEEDGVALYVSMNHTLCVKDRQRLQDRQTHCGDLLLIHPADKQRHQFLWFSSQSGVKSSWATIMCITQGVYMQTQVQFKT